MGNLGKTGWEYACCMYVTYVTYNLICVQRATMLQETLRDILHLEELKKDTVTTRSVLASAKRLIGLKNETEQQHLALLVTKMGQSYSDMLASVTRYKLHSRKREKLWVLFHNFSLQEGYKMCDSCDKVLNLEAHEIFWQLLMEKEFIRQVLKALPTSTEFMSTASCSRVLTYIQSWICYQKTRQ